MRFATETYLSVSFPFHSLMYRCDPIPLDKSFSEEKKKEFLHLIHTNKEYTIARRALVLRACTFPLEDWYVIINFCAMLLGYALGYPDDVTTLLFLEF